MRLSAAAEKTVLAVLWRVPVQAFLATILTSATVESPLQAVPLIWELDAL